MGIEEQARCLESPRLEALGLVHPQGIETPTGFGALASSVFWVFFAGHPNEKKSTFLV